MSRIDLRDGIHIAFTKLGNGNLGAFTAMMEMVRVAATIDPQSALAEWTPLLSLDTHGIYGDRIWMLYSDVCHRNAVMTLALLRSVQLGLTPSEVMQHAIDHRGEGVDLDAVLAGVRERLPRFAAEAVPEVQP